MPKAYWIARVDVNDPEQYKLYVQRNDAVFAKFGGRFLVRAGQFENPEGSSRGRNVVIEFPSYEVALACYHSPEYAPQITLRQAAAEADIVIVEGYDGPQPGEPVSD
ncbi:DUF1330 domain-containing protein [Roseateles sp. P5_D6]